MTCRINHKRQAEELSARAARDFDDYYKMRQCSPDTNTVSSKILVISADGKEGIVMHKEDLRALMR